MSRYITVAIHTYEKALALRSLLESEGIAVELNNVNLEVPGFSSGVRVRIPESDLPLALRIIENKELFRADNGDDRVDNHSLLVPVDLSEKSLKAACIAAEIAARKKQSITLLYSYMDPYISGNVSFTDVVSYETNLPGTRESIEAEAHSLMKNFAERFRSLMKKGEIPVVRIRTKVVEGVPEDAIIEYAKIDMPPLIVMGTRCASQKGLDMIGSVSAEVLDEGRFTVLTVPEPIEIEKSFQPENILFMSNLDQDDILAMDALYRLFPTGTAKVSIVHIPKKKRLSEQSTDKAIRRLSDYCCNNFSHFHFVSVPVTSDNSEKEFAKLNEKHKFDLVVVPNRHRNAFSRLFNPGLAHKILFHSDIPMLVIPV